MIDGWTGYMKVYWAAFPDLGHGLASTRLRSTALYLLRL